MRCSALLIVTVCTVKANIYQSTRAKSEKKFTTSVRDKGDARNAAAAGGA